MDVNFDGRKWEGPTRIFTRRNTRVLHATFCQNLQSISQVLSGIEQEHEINCNFGQIEVTFFCSSKSPGLIEGHKDNKGCHYTKKTTLYPVTWRATKHR